MLVAAVDTINQAMWRSAGLPGAVGLAAIESGLESWMMLADMADWGCTVVTCTLASPRKVVSSGSLSIKPNCPAQLACTRRSFAAMQATASRVGALTPRQSAAVGPCRHARRCVSVRAEGAASVPSNFFGSALRPRCVWQPLQRCSHGSIDSHARPRHLQPGVREEPTPRCDVR